MSDQNGYGSRLLDVVRSACAADGHADEMTLVGLVEGSLPGHVERIVSQHLEACDVCAAHVFGVRETLRLLADKEHREGITPAPAGELLSVRIRRGLAAAAPRQVLAGSCPAFRVELEGEPGGDCTRHVATIEVLLGFACEGGVHVRWLQGAALVARDTGADLTTAFVAIDVGAAQNLHAILSRALAMKVQR